MKIKEKIISSSFKGMFEEIKVGDFVAYPASDEIHYGRVKEIVQKGQSSKKKPRIEIRRFVQRVNEKMRMKIQTICLSRTNHVLKIDAELIAFSAKQSALWPKE